MQDILHHIPTLDRHKENLLYASEHEPETKKCSHDRKKIVKLTVKSYFLKNRFSQKVHANDLSFS